MASPRISAHAVLGLIGEGWPSAGPAYQGLADALRLLIADGRIIHGTRLPSERSLTTALGLSRTTVTRAYDELRSRGYLTSRHGSGSVATLPGGGRASSPNVLDPGSSGTSWIDLTCAAPPGPPGMAAAYAAAADALPTHLSGPGYYPLGLPQLREAIAARFTARGLATEPDQILVTSGALAGVAVVARALLSVGDRALTESPSYPNSLASLRRAGARLVPTPTAPTGTNLKALAAVVAQTRPRLAMLIPDFHNPTSALLDEDDRAQAAATLTEYEVIPVIDETLCELALDEATANSMPAPFAAFHPGTITVGSASKSHWGGLRLGWIRAPHGQIGRLLSARLSLDLGASVIDQLVLTQLLAAGPVVSPVRRAALRHSRDTLVDALTGSLPQWEFVVPRGGLSVWCHLPAPRASALVAAAERRGVLMAAGSSFAPDGHGLESFLRIPFTIGPDLLCRAVEVLAETWEFARGDGATRSTTRPIVA